MYNVMCECVSIYTLTGHFIRYSLLVPGWTPFAFRTALILHGIDSTRCWKNSSEILVHIDMIASHSCCRFVGCTSMMWISRSTTSQRCSIGLRSGDCGGHLSARAQCHIQRLCLGNRRMSAASIAAEVEGVGGQPVSAHTPHTASNWSARLSSQKEASSKDDAQESLQTVCWKQADYGHGLLEPCPVVWWDQDKLIWFR